MILKASIEYPVCPHCSTLLSNNVIIQTRSKNVYFNEKNILEGNYKCYNCNKPFNVFVETVVRTKPDTDVLSPLFIQELENAVDGKDLHLIVERQRHSLKYSPAYYWIILIRSCATPEQAWRIKVKYELHKLKPYK